MPKPIAQTERYSVFQSGTDRLEDVFQPETTRKAPKRIGKITNSVGVFGLSAVVGMIAMGGPAKAADAAQMATLTGTHTGIIMVGVATLFACMLVMVRKTWRQTTTEISLAQRLSTHRVR